MWTGQRRGFEKLKLDDFDIFESIRNKVGGGSMIGIHSSLNGKLVSEYSDEFELLVVQGTIAKKSVRIMTRYGPQESWLEENRLLFFASLEEEITKAELNGCSIFI